MNIDSLKTLANMRSEHPDLSNISRELTFLVGDALADNNGKLSRAVRYLSTGMSLINIGKSCFSLYKAINEPDQYQIRIRSDEFIYSVVEQWIMDVTDLTTFNSIYASANVFDRDDEEWEEEVVEVDGKARRAQQIVRVTPEFDGKISENLIIAGHNVIVSIDYDSNNQSSDHRSVHSGFTREMILSCPSAQAREEVMREIQNKSQGRVNRAPSVYQPAGYGGWDSKRSVAQRRASSVFLKEGQMERILSHINTFWENRESYERADIPFRTGIMLHGDPGTGKTSTALAISNELGMDVYQINISSLQSDDALRNYFQQVPENSVIILEDIDSVTAMKTRDKDDTKGVTMSGILNVLDGINSPIGVVIIMTTNDLEALDAASIRPGRVDLLEELSNIDDYQLRNLCEHFMGEVPEDLPHITPDDKISSAAIIGIFRKHFGNFGGAGDDIVKFVTEKVLEKLEV